MLGTNRDILAEIGPLFYKKISFRCQRLLLIVNVEIEM